MRASLALLIAMTGCAEQDEEPLECKCVDYTVAANVGFDRLVAEWTYDGRQPIAREYIGQPTRMQLVQYSDPFHGPDKLTATAYDAQGVVGSATVRLEYAHVVDYYYEAKGTLWLAPP